MPWVSRAWKAKWLPVVWELVQLLSVVLSAAEATGCADGVVLASTADTYCACPGIAEGLNTGAGGTQQPKALAGLWIKRQLYRGSGS